MNQHFLRKIVERFHQILDLSQRKVEDLSDQNILDHYWQYYLQELIVNKEERDELLQFLPNQKDQLGFIYEFFFQHEPSWDNNIVKIVQKTPKKREPGKIYTPFHVINLIIHLVRNSLIKNLESNKESNKESNRESNRELNEKLIIDQELKIADISCGTGRFLIEWSLQEEDNPISNKIMYFGYDIDSTALSIAKQTHLQNVIWRNMDSLLESDLDIINQFDIIIGNPPYIESRAIPDKNWDIFKKKYQCAHKKFDLSIIFLERIYHLLKPGGWAGLIISNKWLVSDYGEKIRQLLLTHTHISQIIDISQLKVFKNTSTYPIIIIFQKFQHPDTKIPNLQIKLSKPNQSGKFEHLHSNSFSNYYIPQSFFLHSPKNIISSNVDSSSRQILEHFWDLERKNKSILLGDYKCPYELRKGIHTGNVKGKLFTTNPPHNDPTYKHAVTSRYRVDRFKISWQGFWVHYSKKLIDQTKGEYGSLRKEWIFEAQPKIFIKLFGTRIQAALDHLRYYANNSLILLIRKQKNEGLKYNPENWYVSREEEFYYILGVLNSQLISYYYKTLFKHTHVRGNYLQYFIKDLNQIPLIIPNDENLLIMRNIATNAKELENLYDHHELDSDLILKIEEKLNSNVKKLYKK